MSDLWPLALAIGAALFTLGFVVGGGFLAFRLGSIPDEENGDG